MLLTSLILTLSLTANGNALEPDDLRIFTERDMSQLAQKIGKSLLKCKQLGGHPNVIVDVQNNTDDFIDKTKFSALIHAEIEWKTHKSPETSPPQFEIRASLENEKTAIHGLTKSNYTITAQVIQAEENLCEKRATISKKFRSAPTPINRK